MKVNTTLIRRTVVSLSAIAALIVTGYAAAQTAQTVQLVGSTTNNCVYSSMTVTPNGGVLVQCGGSPSGPGTFTITGPTSLATGSTTSGTTVKVSRSGGSTGAVDVTIALSASSTSACSPTTTLVSFADADVTAKGVVVDAGASAGSCILSISPSAGTAGGSGTLTMQVVDPNADVSFAFQSATSIAQIGTAPTVITATRTGGTNGAWSVPVTLSGGLAPLGTLPATSGQVSGLSFTFAANSSTANITYTPPAVMPAASDLTFTLQAPVAVGTPIAGQAGTLGAVKVNALSLTGPAVGCPAFSGTVKSLNTAGFVNHMVGTSPYTMVFGLPANTSGFGILGLYSNTTTPKIGPTLTEIKISKCMGDFTDNADGCYEAKGSLDGTQINQEWAPRYTTRYPNAAAFVKQQRCLTAGAGPWYINIRMTFPTGACASATNPSGSSCGWDAIWKNGSTL